SALTASDEDRVCLTVAGHPFNGNGEVWVLDGTSLIHTQTFYWHGTPLRDFFGPDMPAPTSFPLIENTDTRIVAGDPADPITIDITDGQFLDSGVLHQSGHADVVLPQIESCR